jgi:hypothetical protein
LSDKVGFLISPWWAMLQSSCRLQAAGFRVQAASTNFSDKVGLLMLLGWAMQQPGLKLQASDFNAQGASTNFSDKVAFLIPLVPNCFHQLF